MRALWLTLVLATMAPARAEPPPSARAERLAKLCRIWGAVRYLDPWMWSRAVDWDAALLRALPKARAAASDGEFADAVSSMLGELHDPATRVTTRRHESDNASPVAAPFWSWPRPGTLLVRIAARHALGDVAEATARIKDAKRVILDLRMTKQAGSTYGVARDAQALLFAFVTHELRVPPLRSLVHHGYNAQTDLVLTPINRSSKRSRSRSLRPSAAPCGVRWR
jgi:hypothetical protein